jgi:hypothetical protein
MGIKFQSTSLFPILWARLAPRGVQLRIIPFNRPVTFDHVPGVPIINQMLLNGPTVVTSSSPDCLRWDFHEQIRVLVYPIQFQRCGVFPVARIHHK